MTDTIEGGVIPQLLESVTTATHLQPLHDLLQDLGGDELRLPAALVIQLKSIEVVTCQHLIESPSQLIDTGSCIRALCRNSGDHCTEVNVLMVELHVVTVKVLQLNMGHVDLRIEAHELGRQIFNHVHLFLQVCQHRVGLDL